MMDLNIAFDKIFFISFIDIDELLRIPVCERKPATLYLHHNAVSFFKCMRDRR